MRSRWRQMRPEEGKGREGEEEGKRREKGEEEGKQVLCKTRFPTILLERERERERERETDTHI